MMTSDDNDSVDMNNNKTNTKGSVEATRNNNSASLVVMSSANCDNYNPMCQLYESINSREKIPIIKQSGGGWWRRKRPPQQQSQMSSSNSHAVQSTVLVSLLLLLIVCPRGVWSWSAQRDASFYQQPADDYYSGD